MTTTDVMAVLSDALQASDSAESSYVELPLAGVNEFLIFLKPGVVSALRRDNHTLSSMLNSSFDKYAVEFHGSRVVNGELIRANRTIREHYGTINQVSEHGVEAFDAVAKESIAGLAGGSPLEILGAHQMLDRFPELTPRELTQMFDSGEIHRLSGGTYGVFVETSSGEALLLNGFHPEQVLEFEHPEAEILLLQCTSSTPWSTLRQDMVGATNPANARMGSIRQNLLAESATYGLPDVSSLRNGIHMSAGPVEGMSELNRFFLPFGSAGRTAGVLRTTFGRMCAQRGLGDLAAALADNAVVELDAQIGRAFDVFEEWDTRDLIEKLDSVVIVQR
ncbi:hypothetical protein [Gordonia terrae]